MLKKITLLISLTLLTNFVQAKTVKLNEYINAYMNYSPQIKKSIEDVVAAKGQLQKNKGFNDIILKANGIYSYKKKVTSSILAIDKLKNYSADIGLQKSFSATGTRVGISHQLAYSDTNYGTNPYASITELNFLNGTNSQAYTNSITFSVIQPVLKNMFGLLDRYPIQKAELAKKINQVYLEELKEQKKLEAIITYLNWSALFKQQTILNEIINNNRAVLNQTRRKSKAGVSDIADLEAARSSVLYYENEFNRVQKDYFKVMNEMKKALNLSEKDTPDLTLLSKKHQASKLKIDSKLRNLQMLDLSIKQLKLDISAADNSLLPSLDIVGGYTLYESNKELGKSYSNLGTSEFYAGFQFSMPLGGNSEKGNKKSVNANYKKVLIDRFETQKDLRKIQDNLLYELAKQDQIVKKQQAYINSLFRKYNDERKQYRQGRKGLTDIVRTSNELSNARLKRTLDQITYQQYYFQYLELVDLLSKEIK